MGAGPPGTGQAAPGVEEECGEVVPIMNRNSSRSLGDLELQPAADAAGRLNFGNPIAVPLQKWKSRFAGTNDYSLASFVNYISSYEDPGSTLVPVIEPFLTWDMTFQWRFPDSGFDVTLYGLNLTGEARLPGRTSNCRTTASRMTPRAAA